MSALLDEISQRIDSVSKTLEKNKRQLADLKRCYRVELSHYVDDMSIDELKYVLKNFYKDGEGEE